MSDIATLGIRVDSSQAVSATNALQGLARAAGPAATAANNLAKSSTVASNASRQLAASTGLARHEMINLSRQVQDVGVSLASGQSPLMVLAQQGTQIADIFASSRGNVRGFAGQLASIITPTRALALGTGLLGAAAYVAYGQWKSFAKQLDDTARITGETTSEVAKLQAVAGTKGISSEEFAGGMARFSREVYNAKAGVGGLVEVLRANGVPAVRSVSDAWDKAADLIKNASSDQQRLVLLQQMGLPATMEWVKLLSQGAEGIRKAKSEFEGVSKANDELLKKQRELDAAWDTFWTKAGEKSRNFFVSMVSGTASMLGEISKGFAQTAGVPKDSFGDRFHFAGGSSAAVATGSATARGKPTVDPAVLQAQISREQQRLALLGQTTTAAEARRQVELQLNAAGLQGIAIDKQRAETLKRLAEENALGITQIKGATDAWKIEAETVGMSTGKAIEYATVQERLNEARRNGRTLSDENIAAIRREGAALGEAAQRADDMRFGYEGLVRGPLQTFRQELQNGATWFDAIKKAGLNALDSLASKLMDIASQKLWQSAFGGGGGFSLGSLFGLGGGTGSFATDGIGGFGPTLPTMHTGHGPGDRLGSFRSLPRFHDGVGPGEQHAIIRNDESVLTPGQMRQLAPVGSGDSITIEGMNVTIQGNADDKALRQLERMNRDFEARVIQAVRSGKQRRAL